MSQELMLFKGQFVKLFVILMGGFDQLCFFFQHCWEQYVNVCLVLTGMRAGDVGLALSYAVTLMGMFQWGVRQSAEVENMVRT